MLHASHSTSVLQWLKCFSQLSCFPLMWPKMTCGCSVWMVSASGDDLTVYLKRSGDSIADNCAEISKPLATPLFILCEIRRFNNDVNHLSLADCSDRNRNMITGKCCAVRDLVISKKVCRYKVLRVCAFLCLRHTGWLTTLKMTGHQWPYLVQFLLGDSVMTRSVSTSG